MGSTPFYGLPYPELTDPPDGAGQIKALADKLELWKSGFNIPTGDLNIGDLTVANARMINIRKLDGADNYEGKIYIGTGGSIAFVLNKNGVEVGRFRLHPDNTLSTGTGATFRNLPFSTAIVKGSVALSNATSGTAVIPLPPNRFTVAPNCIATTDTSSYFAAVTAASATSISVSVRHHLNTAGSGNIGVTAHAIQMLSTTAEG